MRSAVVGDDQLKVAFHGIAESDAVLFIPKGNGIEEGIRVGVLELEHPRFAAVSRFVDSGIGALAGAQKVGRGFSKGFDIAEIESIRIGDSADCPSRAGVRGSSVGPFGAADPCNFRTDGT
jgi:hypothetical protein